MENQKLKFQRVSFLLFLLVSLTCAGCGRDTYHQETIAKDLATICKTEYGVDSIQVKSSGKTIAVFLPLKKLFNTNFKEALASQKIQNIEALLQPSQEALDKVEDVLFSTSRVILSLDKPIDFYVLHATDVETTGLQLVLTGYVDDIKRVRLWDIPRSEYRKRVLHDLRLNRTVVWSKPVLQIFESIGKKSADHIIENYFKIGDPEELISPLFREVLEDGEHKTDVQYEFLDVRSQNVQPGEALVYVKLKETYKIKSGDTHSFLYPSGSVLEYVFVIKGVPPDRFVISKVIPFFYADDNKALKKVAIPADLKLEENLDQWQPFFDVEDIRLGDFLAKQLNRRMEALLGSDERVFNTFAATKVNIRYHLAQAGSRHYFSIDMDLEPKTASPDFGTTSDWAAQDDTLYILNLILKEFVTVLRAYQFNDFDHFELTNTAIPSSVGAVLPKSELELFRRGKININGLLHPAAASF